MVLILSAIGLVLDIVVWFFIARRGSNSAKWIVVGVAIIGGPIVIYDIFTGGYDGLSTVYIGMDILTVILYLTAILLLFRADAVRWLDSSGVDGEIDPQVFD